MENMEEAILFAKEMLSQKPSRGLLKVYLVGSVFAVLGTVIGLVETVCRPFSSETTDPELTFMVAQKKRTVEPEPQPQPQRSVGSDDSQEEELAETNGAKTRIVSLSKTHRHSQRNMANRLHAS